MVMRPPVQLWSQGYRKPLRHQLPPGSCLEGPEHSLWGPVSPSCNDAQGKHPLPGILTGGLVVAIPMCQPSSH